MRGASAGIAASSVLVAVNHGLLATMLYFARDHSTRESGLFTAENLSTDVLPEASLERAAETAERIRQAVADMVVRASTAAEPIHAAVSMGVAGFPGDAKAVEELMHRADLGVHATKVRGRNRVVAAVELASQALAGRLSG